ncbi:hypothetical protein NQ318_020735 [Aromia moschata]|uniref:Uncharacterized protein n=1 Tax=Aromia moschata TaxID=1265417 RepID=A0AAV8YZJ7_9CUCU|nr:hypothetical protein NQ318_020735 [Aromia moschata]
MKCMNRDAEVNMTKYEQYVKELSEESTRFLPNQDDGIAEETITVAEEKQDFPESPELTEMERDKRKVPAKLENERPDDDLEQWLDDILDD